MNKVVLIGRPTKDPELKYAPGSGTAVCTFTLAVDREFKNANGEKEADFLPVVVWRKQAENVATYVNKGKLIAVTGRIQTRSYDAKDGAKRYITEIVAENVQFLEKMNQGTSTAAPTEDPDLIPIEDGEIPF